MMVTFLVCKFSEFKESNILNKVTDIFTQRHLEVFFMTNTGINLPVYIANLISMLFCMKMISRPERGMKRPHQTENISHNEGLPSKNIVYMYLSCIYFA